MADAHTRIGNLKEDIREIGFSLLDLQARARVHDSKLEQCLATLTEHGTRLDTHDRRFDAIDARLDAHDRRFDAIDARLDAHDGRFDAIDGRFDAVDGRFDQIGAQLAEVLARLPQRPG
jgi:chromosome segregation ATPase